MLHALYLVDASRFSAGLDIREILSELERPSENRSRRSANARESAASVPKGRRTGPPARVILDYATDDEVDFVAIGTQGRSGLERHFLGNAMENAVRNAELPVFCVPMSGE